MAVRLLSRAKVVSTTSSLLSSTPLAEVDVLREPAAPEAQRRGSAHASQPPLQKSQRRCLRKVLGSSVSSQSSVEVPQKTGSSQHVLKG